MRKKEKKYFFNFILVIRIFLLVVIFYCLVKIGLWFNENQKNSGILDNVIENSVLNTRSIIVPATDDDSNIVYDTTTNISTYELDFDKLLSLNSSTTRLAYCSGN